MSNTDSTRQAYALLEMLDGERVPIGIEALGDPYEKLIVNGPDLIRALANQVVDLTGTLRRNREESTLALAAAEQRATAAMDTRDIWRGKAEERAARIAELEAALHNSKTTEEIVAEIREAKQDVRRAVFGEDPGTTPEGTWETFSESALVGYVIERTTAGVVWRCTECEDSGLRTSPEDAHEDAISHMTSAHGKD